MKITNEIIHIGVNDYNIDLFEGQYMVEKGMAYNSYIITDEKTAVLDTVDKAFGDEWLTNIESVIGTKSPDYLIVQHMEPDHSANIDRFMTKYPEAKIICIDAYTCCFGLGMICIKASEMRSEGKSIEETAKWVEDHRAMFHQEGSVDKLEYLKRAGRVSAASAFFGGLLNIKPIIICDVKGRNTAVEKVKGRRNSLNRIVERFKERYVGGVCKQIYISHADCLEDAELLKSMVQEVVQGQDVEIKIGYVVSPIGASVGPGMIGLYFYGQEITYDAEKK